MKPAGLHEDLVPKAIGVRQVVEHFSAGRPRGVDLDLAVAKHPAEHALLGAHVLHPVDRDDLFLAAEDARLDRDALVGQRVGDRLPADPDDDEPEQGESDHADREEGPELRHVEAIARSEQRKVGDDRDHEQDHGDDQALDDRDPVWVIPQNEVLAGQELAHGRVLSPT